MVWIEIRSALEVLLRVLRLMRKVKQSAWRRRQGEGELDGDVE